MSDPFDDEDLLLLHAEDSPHRGELPDATHHHAGRLPVCGDDVQLAARIDSGRIAAIRFVARGSVLCRAAASLLCEWAEGRSTDEAAGLDGAAMLRLVPLPVTARQTPRALLPLSVLKELLAAGKSRSVGA